MKIFLTIFHIAPVAHVKSLSKAFLSFLLVVSFLASCTTEDPLNTGNGDGSVVPTVGCPDGLVVLTLTDGATELTLTEELIRVTVTGNFADAPTLTYDPATVTAETTSVTVTAMDTVGNTTMCDFNVYVNDTAVTLSACPDDINNGIINTERRWTAPAVAGGPEGATVAVSVTSDDAAVSTATVSETGGTFAEAGTYTVTFTATTADGTSIIVNRDSLSCSFEVMVNAMALPLVITCPLGAPLSVVIPFGETSVTLTDALSSVSSTGGEGTVTFSYDTNAFTSDHVDMTITVTATATDMASSPATDECTFMVMVTAAPEPTITCPTSINTAVNVAVTWDEPTITDRPAGTTIDLSVTSMNAADATVTTTTGTFSTTGTYTILFTAMSNGEAIIVGEPSTDLACTLTVRVDDMPRPGNSLFFLDNNDNAPGPSNPLLIENANDLNNLAMAVSSDSNYTINQIEYNYRTSTYRLESNIELDTTGTDDNFIPIGIGKAVIVSTIIGSQLVTTCDNKCFEGTFDGASNTISGLRFSNGSTTDINSTNVGLFAVISGESTSISNLILTDVDITGHNNVGGLVGAMLDSASISNVSVTGDVNGSAVSGGLVGLMSNSSMTNASASVTVSSEDSRAGGLVGEMTASMITNAFASGAVTGSSSLGGLVGLMTSTSSITNAYASGAVGTDTSSAVVGGLVGGFRNTASLQNTLAWGKVMGQSTSSGGLVALVFSTDITITNSYWDNTTEGTGQSTSAGTGATGQTTAALQGPMAAEGIYADWNNTATDNPAGAGVVWNFGTGTEYPALEIAGSLFPSVACQRDPNGIDCPDRQ